MLYILLFRHNSLGGLILLVLLTILASHIGINSLSGKRKRTPSNNNSYEVRVLLNNKRKKITKVKRIAMFTKQIK